MKIVLMAVAGVAVVAICNVNRAHSGTIEGVPYIIPIVLVVLGAWTVLLQRTRFGRYVYAIGGNAEAARRAGVSLPAVRIWGFVLAALTSGIAGVLFASWQVSLTTNIIKAANSYVLLAVAAAVIGGTSLFGGRGKTIHGVLGGLVIGGIYNGLYLLGVSSQWIRRRGRRGATRGGGRRCPLAPRRAAPSVTSAEATTEARLAAPPPGKGCLRPPVPWFDWGGLAAARRLESIPPGGWRRPQPHHGTAEYLAWHTSSRKQACSGVGEIPNRR